MMSSTEINDAVNGVMALRGDRESSRQNPKSLAVSIDRLHDDLNIEGLEDGTIEPEILGINLTRTDYRYTSDKQLESARNATKHSTFGR